MIAIVASTSLLKIRAVQSAMQCRRQNITVVGMESQSGIFVQPYSTTQIAEGARNRVYNLIRMGIEPYLIIGIENGIYWNGKFGFDMAAVYAYRKHGHVLVRRQLFWSPAVKVPRSLLTETSHRGFGNTTIGQVLQEKCPLLMADSADPQTILSGGTMSRHRQLMIGAYGALKAVGL